MQIYVMRHGNAVQTGSIDAERELTVLGFEEAKLMAHWLAQQNPSIDKILVSPFLRAQQTAITVKHIVDDTLTCQTLSFITPSGDAKQLHDFIDGEELNANLLIVSHMPLVSYLVAELTGGQEAPIFQTAAIAQIDYDQQQMRGQLVRLISPFEIK